MRALIVAVFLALAGSGRARTVAADAAAGSRPAADHSKSRSTTSRLTRRHRCAGATSSSDLTKDDFQVVEEGQAPDHLRVHARRSPDRAPGSAALQAGGDRAGRQVQPRRVHRPRVSHRARRPADRSLAHDARAGGGPAVHPALRRRQRHGCGGDDRRQHDGRPGVHEQPRAPAGRGGQVHGAEDAPRGPGHGAELQGAQHLRDARQSRRVHGRRSAAGARPSSGSAKASTTTSTTRSPRGTPTSSGWPCRTRLRRRPART